MFAKNKFMEQITTPHLKTSSLKIFDDGNVYININRMFFAYSGIIPNVKCIRDIDNTKFRKHIESNFANEIEHTQYKQEYSRKKKKMMYADLMFFMKDGTMLNLCDEWMGIAFVPDNANTAQRWMDIAIPFKLKNRSKTSEICLMVQGADGIKTTAIKIKKPKLELTTNYNDDIVEIHQSFVKKLRTKNASGLFLFYGTPGTGKSTYIKFLIHHLNKNVIFMSPRLAGSLDAPELMSFLIRNKNSVIVIEDAEELIITRDAGRNSTISTILNLTDGLLGECLNIQMIATFNTQITNIDKALLRKGRLQGMYEFKDLAVTKAQELSNKLGYENTVTQPMSLANIYNQNEQQHDFNKRQAIGFRTA